jgi:hypothetical protein
MAALVRRADDLAARTVLTTAEGTHVADGDRAGPRESGALHAAIKDAERLRPQPVLGAVDPTGRRMGGW